MKHIVILMITGFLMGWGAQAQEAKEPDASYKEKYDQINELLASENYGQALVFLHELDKTYHNANLAYLIGYCYLNSPIEKDKAIEHLKYASENTSTKYNGENYKETNAPSYVVEFLGDAYHVNYQIKKAFATYSAYKETLSKKDKQGLVDIDRKLEITNNAMNLMNFPVNMTTSNVGGAVNSKWADYSPVITADESVIIFTSRREGSTGGQQDEEGKFFEDIYWSANLHGEWGEPQKLNICSDGHEAPLGLSPDGQQMLIYKFSGETGGDIWYSKLEGNDWTEPTKLGSNVNTEAWESHATFNGDGDVIAFTSERENGKGGRDIWFSKKLPDGTWGEAQNFGPNVNTEWDEGSPYLHPDGKTLYFSSQGHKTMGGYDIFTSTLQADGTWGVPENVGYPINTTGDDLYYLPTADGKGAYYASSSIKGFGEKDIYRISVPEAEEKHLVVYTGTILNSKGEVPDDIYIEVTDNETGELVGSYMPNSATGKYLFILKPGFNYNITYESEKDCYFHSENLIVPVDAAYQVISKSVEMDPLQTGSVVQLNNIFYEYGSAALTTPQSLAELTKMVKIMKDCENIKIEIAGHTDNHGTDEYNMKLSQARCQSVIDYLTKEGVAIERMVPKGYGEHQPVAPNENADGSDDPEGRAQNRRTELRVR